MRWPHQDQLDCQDQQCETKIFQTKTKTTVFDLESTSPPATLTDTVTYWADLLRWNSGFWKHGPQVMKFIFLLLHLQYQYSVADMTSINNEQHNNSSISSWGLDQYRSTILCSSHKEWYSHCTVFHRTGITDYFGTFKSTTYATSQKISSTKSVSRDFPGPWKIENFT